MRSYDLYNNDVLVAEFQTQGGTLHSFTPLRKELLPMQVANASADGFALWLQNRSIDLNTFQHRQLVYALTGSRDKISVAIATHMFSISDTFTCFDKAEFIPRGQLCNPLDQAQVSDFILVSSDTSLKNTGMVTPNASTDGCFTKTWKYERGEWWLYKLQSADATKSECEISKVLRACGYSAAEYEYDGCVRTRIKTRNFVGDNEFFEPYESVRFMFDDKSDDEQVVYDNIASLGSSFELEWRRILLADALFMNTDRHMRNFGVIRSAVTGKLLRMAPNFDNNQAYLANPGGTYSERMLTNFFQSYHPKKQDHNDLAKMVDACEHIDYMKQAAEVGRRIIS